MNQLESAQSEKIIIIIYYVNHTKVHDKNNLKKKQKRGKNIQKNKKTPHMVHI